jgi:4'-phosphopantetheinyl transferase
LDLDEPRLAAMRALLSDDELQRAARFHFERDRNHFIAARGLLRQLLGRYLDREPAALCFAYGARGKPTLLGHALRFNLSHSHGLALFAFALGCELGIDVEQIRLGFAAAEIAQHFFSPCEVAALRALPAAQQAEGFFNCWTRKEAFIKGRGDGLYMPLESFDVTLTPGEPAQMLEVRGEPGAAARWFLEALTPEPGYAAALAVEGCTPRLTLFGLAYRVLP